MLIPFPAGAAIDVRPLIFQRHGISLPAFEVFHNGNSDANKDL